MEKKIKQITYGIGGYDETKPNNNIIEIEYYTDEELAALDDQSSSES